MTLQQESCTGRYLCQDNVTTHVKLDQSVQIYGDITVTSNICTKYSVLRVPTQLTDQSVCIVNADFELYWSVYTRTSCRRSRHSYWSKAKAKRLREHTKEEIVSILHFVDPEERITLYFLDLWHKFNACLKIQQNFLKFVHKFLIQKVWSHCVSWFVRMFSGQNFTVFLELCWTINLSLSFVKTLRRGLSTMDYLDVSYW